jgi:hypothetical protein
VACFAKGDETMFHNTSLTGPKQNYSLDDRPCIRLQADHSSYHRAAELLATLGGRRFISAVGMVYTFESATERDAALDRARREMGWTIGTSFDDRPGLSGDPPACWMTWLVGPGSRLIEPRSHFRL